MKTYWSSIKKKLKKEEKERNMSYPELIPFSFYLPSVMFR